MHVMNVEYFLCACVDKKRINCVLKESKELEEWREMKLFHFVLYFGVELGR